MESVYSIAAMVVHACRCMANHSSDVLVLLWNEAEAVSIDEPITMRKIVSEVVCVHGYPRVLCHVLSAQFGLKPETCHTAMQVLPRILLLLLDSVVALGPSFFE